MSTFEGETNKIKRVILPSTIEQVLWARPTAAPGGTVGLEIFTHFVGNGSELQIELSDAGGKKHGIFREQITGDRFWAKIQVPPKAEKALIATVKLPKHGLEESSAALLLTPPVTLRNTAWSAKEARRGDVLTLRAEVEGVPDGMEAELTIFEHDADGAHDLVTKFPVLVRGGKVDAEWEFEYTEDTDDIPSREDTEKGYNPPEYFFRVEIAGVTAQSEVLAFKDWFEIELSMPDGAPLGDERYRAAFADGSVREGRLGADGTVRLKDVPPGPVDVVFPDLD